MHQRLCHVAASLDLHELYLVHGEWRLGEGDLRLSSVLQFGYSIYRTVLGYYSGDEDAYDMRKAMSRDKEGRSVIPLTRPIYPHELEHD